MQIENILLYLSERVSLNSVIYIALEYIGQKHLKIRLSQVLVP